MKDKISLLFFRLMNRRKSINTSRRIVVGFFMLIILGALLLMLPISSKTGEVTPVLTAFFTATSATCVTGLVLVDTGAYYSLFGQAVIIVLIQIGGLGFMTILTLAFFATRKSMGMRDRMLMAQTLGADSMSEVIKTTKHVLIASGFFEIIGALLLMIRFVPDYGIKGIWYGIFHSVSAFCNAGFDIIGKGNSMYSYGKDPIVMLTLSMLIIIGGTGFLVWEDFYKKRSLKRINLYSKLVLIITLILLISGTLLFYVLERNNPLTIGKETVPFKILSSFFQSVTCRTAGFDAIGQAELTEQSKLLSIILMMIGGASGSTAGGVKVVSVGIAFLTIISVLRTRKEVVVLGRRLSRTNINYAFALIAMWACLVMSAGLFISMFDSSNLLDTLYEITSAYGTVGLSVGITASSSVLTKLILIVYMFFGRVGIMTISVTFMGRAYKAQEIKYPDGNVMIG